MGTKGLSIPPNTITWLRDYLNQVGPINSYGFLKFLRGQADAIIITPDMPRDERNRLRDMQKAFRSVSYNSIRRLFWMLRQVDAIEFSHQQPSRRGRPRVFYKMADERWFVTGLQTYFYPATQLGGMRYRDYVSKQKPPPSLMRWERIEGTTRSRRVLGPALPPPGVDPDEVPDIRGSKYWLEPPRAEEDLPSKPSRRGKGRRREEEE